MWGYSLFVFVELNNSRSIDDAFAEFDQSVYVGPIKDWNNRIHANNNKYEPFHVDIIRFVEDACAAPVKLKKKHLA